MQLITKQNIIQWLSYDEEHCSDLFLKAQNSKKQFTKNKVFLRGLIEYSNVCSKNCLYCGLRSHNKILQRYTLSEEDVLSAAEFAYQSKFGSIVIQAGENQSTKYTNTITNLIDKIQNIYNGQLAITLSLGEQSKETLTQWRNAGAKRYLLRIETSNQDLFYSIHPNDNNHSFSNRIKILEVLKELDYQVGTGVMIGLPNQTIDNLADDLLFMKNIDIDMIGMGPYIEHSDTPLYASKNTFSLKERYLLTLKMIASMRILMPDINIAATTALQTIEPNSREKAIAVGANIIMPNITPLKYREQYLLYENKVQQIVDDDYIENIKKCVQSADSEIGWNDFGNSLHYDKRVF